MNNIPRVPRDRLQELMDELHELDKLRQLDFIWWRFLEDTITALDLSEVEKIDTALKALCNLTCPETVINLAGVISVGIPDLETQILELSKNINLRNEPGDLASVKCKVRLILTTHRCKIVPVKKDVVQE